MTLYEIDSAIMALIDEETGEITDLEAFEKLQIDRTAKCENIALLIINISADAAAYKEQKQKFEALQKSAEKRVESLKKYLVTALNGEPLKTSRVSCAFKKSRSITVQDVFKLPNEYLKFSDPTPDKVALKAAIEAGATFEGVELVEKENIIIK